MKDFLYEFIQNSAFHLDANTQEVSSYLTYILRKLEQYGHIGINSNSLL